MNKMLPNIAVGVIVIVSAGLAMYYGRNLPIIKQAKRGFGA